MEQCSEDTRLFELEHAETLGAATENYTASIMQTVLIGPDANVTLLFYSPFEKHFLKEACEAAGGQFTRNPKGSVVLCSYEETGATFALPDFVTCAATTEACEAVLAEDSYWRLLYNVKTLVSTGAECAFVVTGEFVRFWNAKKGTNESIPRTCESDTPTGCCHSQLERYEESPMPTDFSVNSLTHHPFPCFDRPLCFQSITQILPVPDNGGHRDGLRLV